MWWVSAALSSPPLARADNDLPRATTLLVAQEFWFSGRRRWEKINVIYLDVAERTMRGLRRARVKHLQVGSAACAVLINVSEAEEEGDFFSPSIPACPGPVSCRQMEQIAQLV